MNVGQRKERVRRDTSDDRNTDNCESQKTHGGWHSEPTVIKGIRGLALRFWGSMDKPHKRLDVWQKGVELVKQVYEITAGYPPAEQFGLVSQMRRAAVSIISNIAEGAARSSNIDNARFLEIAAGSLSELDAQMDLSVKLGFLSGENRKHIDHLMTDVDRMLAGLRKYLRLSDIQKGTITNE